MRPAQTPRHSTWGGCVLLAAALIAIPATTQAQADTAQARQVFAQINQQLPQLQRITFSAKRPATNYPAQGKAWVDAGVVKKIEIIERDDSGDAVSEFYYSGDSLIFVFEAVQGFANAGQSSKQITVSEERFYYRDGQLFKWLSGLGNNKTDNTPGSPDFSEAGRSRLAASNAFRSAAQKVWAAQSPAK